ncbi:MAG: transposase [Gammaproteobacteria bacterium]|nr:transposase [Gammaproteobacteria bacterium]
MQRGNNRQASFFADDDYHVYLDWLTEYADKNNCLIHTYVLMTNHVHLLGSSSSPKGVSSLMKQLGQRYVQYNHTYRRSGTVSLLFDSG